MDDRAASPLRLGLLGCSPIARRRMLPAIGLLDTVRLSGVAAREIERAKDVAAELGTVASGYDEILGRDDVDAVYISLPNGLHYEWAGNALRAGKHVLCEKPLATTRENAVELTELAASRGLVLRENFSFEHHSQHTEVRQLLAEGRFGTPRTFTGSFCIPPLPPDDTRYNAALGGGALLDIGVYPLRAAQLLLGPDLTVTGATLRVDERLAVDLAGQVQLVSADGVFAQLEFGIQHSYGSRYSLWGSAASVSLDRAFTPPPSRQPVLRITEQDHAEEIVLPPSDQFRNSVEAFVAATGPVVDAAAERPWLDRAVTTARLIDEIRKKAVRVGTRDEGDG
ncbi:MULTISPECIES: Gfo/Idh/MocA family protein [Amycolatopsis]|uniref:Oxidoreductase n=1 Tax=Amycolatopsis bullii TaxID=941987 RepID=A0ABQ3KRG8_9PSEU|nr:Gfo/Idh/MocA family oxidoreductase [Amycolatopsis bullii]GHG47884.1 oxidoreductase [Amycolatopsis bullii]